MSLNVFFVLLLLVQGVNPGAECLSDAESLMIHYGVMEDYFGAYHCHGFDANFGHIANGRPLGLRRRVTEGSRLQHDKSSCGVALFGFPWPLSKIVAPCRID